MRVALHDGPVLEKPLSPGGPRSNSVTRHMGPSSGDSREHRVGMTPPPNILLLDVMDGGGEALTPGGIP